MSSLGERCIVIELEGIPAVNRRPGSPEPSFHRCNNSGDFDDGNRLPRCCPKGCIFCLGIERCQWCLARRPFPAETKAGAVHQGRAEDVRLFQTKHLSMGDCPNYGVVVRIRYSERSKIKE